MPLNAVDDVDILKPEEAAKLLKISTYTLKEHARTGAIPSFKIGNRFRFRKTALVAWIEQMERSDS